MDRNASVDCRDSETQALAALGTTRIDDSATASSLHANEETVGARTADFGSLVGAFHDLS